MVQVAAVVVVLIMVDHLFLLHNGVNQVLDMERVAVVVLKVLLLLKVKDQVVVKQEQMAAVLIMEEVVEPTVEAVAVLLIIVMKHLLDLEQVAVDRALLLFAIPHPYK
jgi:hypothetical protein